MPAGAVARSLNTGTAQNDGPRTIPLRPPKSKVPDGMAFAILRGVACRGAKKEPAMPKSRTWICSTLISAFVLAPLAGCENLPGNGKGQGAVIGGGGGGAAPRPPPEKKTAPRAPPRRA